MDDPRSFLRTFLQEAVDFPVMIVQAVKSSAWAVGHGANGLEDTVVAISSEVENKGHVVPVLLCGLLPQEFLDEKIRSIGGRQLKLWDWPGLVYLQFGFDKEALRTAARKAVKGADRPFPPDLSLIKPEDVLRVTSELRHWLENRRRNMERALVDFEAVAGGKGQLHTSYLEPVAAISDAHQHMLNQFWTLETAARRFAPATGGLAPMKAAIKKFETSWMELEAQRKTLRPDDAGRLEGVVTALKTVADSINNGVAALRLLDDEIRKKA